MSDLKQGDSLPDLRVTPDAGLTKRYADASGDPNPIHLDDEFAKTYAGLSDEEIRRVDAFVRRHTLEKFGPVRTVKPELVFELAFEDIQRSTRHKSGIAVRLPRVARWRTDKRPEEADTLETVRALIEGYEEA